MGSSDTDRDPKTFKVLQSQQLLCSSCGQCSATVPSSLRQEVGRAPELHSLENRDTVLPDLGELALSLRLPRF